MPVQHLAQESGYLRVVVLGVWVFRMTAEPFVRRIFLAFGPFCFDMFWLCAKVLDSLGGSVSKYGCTKSTSLFCSSLIHSHSFCVSMSCEDLPPVIFRKPATLTASLKRYFVSTCCACFFNNFVLLRTRLTPQFHPTFSQFILQINLTPLSPIPMQQKWNFNASLTHPASNDL